MHSPEQEQHPAPALEGAPEPRLLIRSVRSQIIKPPAPKRRRRHSPPGRNRRLRLWSRIALAVILLATLAAFAGVLYFRHALVAALPQIDGQLHVPGLSAPVTVTRDVHGIPTITAANLSDLLFAQGYTTAGDRLWQMDALRRHAAGELAEILGPTLAEHDRRQRYLQIRSTADRAVAQLPPDQMAQLGAYAHGVNAYIDTHHNALPIEFRLLAYKPAPWTPRDSLLVSLAMWQDLSTEFPRKLDREALSAHLPPQLLADLYPVGSWRDQPPAAQGRDLTTPHDVEQIPLDPSQSRLKPPPGTGTPPQSLVALTQSLGGNDRCDGCRSGSNNWAVSGKHTASGAPLLANDMHLSLAIPDIWYEASLHAGPLTAQPGGAGQLDVTGFTLPGTPFVIVGRNPRVAWGVTNLGADVQDLRLEHLRGDGQFTEYERPDSTWAPVTHHREHIVVRGGHDLTLDVITTAHASGAGLMETPIISPLYPGEGRVLSLAWTAYDPTAVTSPFLGVNTATDGNSLVASLAHFGGPALNLVWADAAGGIGYHALGLVPVRGSAVPHAKDGIAPATPAQPGPLPQDEGAEVSPTASSLTDATRPHLTLSAFRPSPSRRPRRAHAPLPAVPVQPPPRTPSVEPAGPVISYTIGSPISPMPVDALDATQAWSTYIPYDALPATVDPRNGFLATANARITPDNFPYSLAIDWADPFRVERIVHLLDGRNHLTPADMLRVQTDAHSDVNLAFAQRLAYALDHADARTLNPDATRLREAANLLRDWNGSMDVASPAAAIVTVVRNALWPALLVPQIAAHDRIDATHAAPLAALYTWAERTSALDLLMEHEPPRWLPPGVANWNDLLAATTASALKQSHAPGHLAKWQYGAIHTVEIAHPVLDAYPLLARVVGVRASTGAQPAPGDSSTVDAIGPHFGPSERFTADLSSPDAGLGNITTGQSANPRSPWYLDQFRPWLSGRSFPLSNARSPQIHTLTLSP